MAPSPFIPPPHGPKGRGEGGSIYFLGELRAFGARLPPKPPGENQLRNFEYFKGEPGAKGARLTRQSPWNQNPKSNLEGALLLIFPLAQNRQDLA